MRLYTSMLFRLGLFWGCGFAVIQVHGQSDTLANWLEGSWKLSSHSVEAYTGSQNLLSENQHITLLFQPDGSYRSTSEFPSKDDVDVVITVGQWDIDEDAAQQQVFLYDNRFLPPHDRDGRSADHPMPLIRMTQDSLWTTECLFFEDPPGVSLYVRTSH